ncbi:preprotein translocase subunit SecG [bacterium DOLZORAL124_38_8]|nr:MAG: preprotein translocase subunit SecG [bacterium DOLZORAL124_38_8]
MKYVYIAICVLFLVSVLLQQKNAGLGSLMGQESGDEVAQTRRGAEVFLHRASIVLAVLFIGIGLLVMAGVVKF